MMIFGRKTSQRGDSLIEVTVAIAILSSVVATTYLTANVATTSGRNANERNDAVALEQQQAEILRNMRDNLTTKQQRSGANNGWSLFKTAIFNGAVPLCGATQSPVDLSNALPAGAGTNTRTYDASTKLLTVGTSTNSYNIDTEGCYPDNSPTGQGSIVFTIKATWQDGPVTNSSELSTTLASVSDINQQDPSYETTP